MQSFVVIRFVASAASEEHFAPTAKLVGIFRTGSPPFLIERGHASAGVETAKVKLCPR